MSNPVHILLVDDDPADAFLTQQAFQDALVPNHVHHVQTGSEALKFLRRDGSYEGSPRPQLILLDLNMPGIQGHEVLAEIKDRPKWRQIPVVMFSSSASARDVAVSYELQAACHIRKPTSLMAYTELIQGVAEFWLRHASLSR
ncbi:MAG: chemotaxis family two-component system response regulator Rcp1 [Myxococcota bacterium]|jgi:chemotaxis family two-component system response regulator Rcp1